MKNLLFFLFVFWGVADGFSQPATLLFSGFGKLTDDITIPTDSTYILELDGWIGGLQGTGDAFAETEIVPGDVIWIMCGRFRIDTLYPTFPIKIGVTSFAGNPVPSENEIGFVCREVNSTNGALVAVPPIAAGSSGLSPDLQQCILLHYGIKGSIGVGRALTKNNGVIHLGSPPQSISQPNLFSETRIVGVDSLTHDTIAAQYNAPDGQGIILSSYQDGGTPLDGVSAWNGSRVEINSQAKTTTIKSRKTFPTDVQSSLIIGPDGASFNKPFNYSTDVSADYDVNSMVSKYWTEIQLGAKLDTSATAGGDISGTFLNLQLNSGAVTNTKIAAGAVDESKMYTPSGGAGGCFIWTGSAWVLNQLDVNSRLSGDGVNTPFDIAQNGADSSQVLAWDGTEWMPTTVIDSTKTVEIVNNVLSENICSATNVVFGDFDGGDFNNGTPPFSYAANPAGVSATTTTSIQSEIGGSFSMVMLTDSSTNGVSFGLDYDSVANHNFEEWNYRVRCTGSGCEYWVNGEMIDNDTYETTYSQNTIHRIFIRNDSVFFQVSLDGGTDWNTQYTFEILLESETIVWPQYNLNKKGSCIYSPKQGVSCETLIENKVRLYNEQNPTGDNQNAAQVPFSPTGTLAAENVQDALTELSGDVAANDISTYWSAGQGSGFSVFTPTNSNTNAIIQPTGTGGFRLDVEGNSRGDNSVDLQIERTLDDEIASGLRATLLAGYKSKASGGTSIAGGYDNYATANYSFATGAGGLAANVGEFTRSTGSFSARGDAQTHMMNFRKEITGTGISELFLDGGGGSRAAISTDNMWVCHIQVVATTKTVGNGTGTLGDSFFGEYSVGIKRVSNMTSLVGTPASILTPFSDTSMATSAVTIAADDTNDALSLQFTPPATAGSTSVYRVVSTSICTEVGY